MSDEQLAKPIPSFHELFERSKNDRAMIVGSEVREVIARVRELEQALREIGKHTMESEDDIDFIIDACRNALRVADRAAG